MSHLDALSISRNAKIPTGSDQIYEYRVLGIREVMSCGFYAIILLFYVGSSG